MHLLSIQDLLNAFLKYVHTCITRFFSCAHPLHSSSPPYLLVLPNTAHSRAPYSDLCTCRSSFQNTLTPLSPLLLAAPTHPQDLNLLIVYLEVNSLATALVRCPFSVYPEHPVLPSHVALSYLTSLAFLFSLLYPNMRAGAVAFVHQCLPVAGT